MKEIKALVLFVILGLLLVPAISFAEHKSTVAGQVINSDDPGIAEAHGEVCDTRHYHGELNDIADPNPHGCGHGEVIAIAHDGGDGETIPPPPKKGLWDRFVSWLGSLNRDDAVNVIDVVAESNGIPPPGTVSDTVDIVKGETPAIMEKVEGIREYRESVSEEDDTLDLYRNPAEGLEEGSISQRFFKWFNGLLD